MVPCQIPDEKLFQPIAAGFAHYPKTDFKFMLGSVTSVDVESRKLQVATHDAQVKALQYDPLVLATGWRTREDTPLKSIRSNGATKTAIYKLQAQIKSAKNVVIVGGRGNWRRDSWRIGIRVRTRKTVILVSLYCIRHDILFQY
ncbi:hypothetical protein GGR57DRAFT_458988 [Xylariaceae sp. FL1272]|nr:hypothetical protein GGR57DRAFT_458988 [Xylariaceae sp. FL1272]